MEATDAGKMVGGVLDALASRLAVPAEQMMAAVCRYVVVDACFEVATGIAFAVMAAAFWRWSVAKMNGRTHGGYSDDLDGMLGWLGVSLGTGVLVIFACVCFCAAPRIIAPEGYVLTHILEGKTP